MVFLHWLFWISSQEGEFGAVRLFAQQCDLASEAEALSCFITKPLEARQHDFCHSHRSAQIQGKGNRSYFLTEGRSKCHPKMGNNLQSSLENITHYVLLSDHQYSPPFCKYTCNPLPNIPQSVKEAAQNAGSWDVNQVQVQIRILMARFLRFSALSPGAVPLNLKTCKLRKHMFHSPHTPTYNGETGVR